MGDRFFADQDNFTENLGDQHSMFERVKWEQSGPIKYTSFNEQIQSPNAPDYSKLCSPKTLTAERIAKIRASYNTNLTLDQLSLDAGGGTFDPIHWIASVSEPANGTLKLADVKVVDGMHTHEVFKSIEFKNMVVYLRFKDNTTPNTSLDVPVYLDQDDTHYNVNAPNISRYVGTNGDVKYSWLVSEKAQIGITKNHAYYFKAGSKLLVLEVNFSCTFLYPSTFEPMGVVSTMKVLPQITFRTNIVDLQMATLWYPGLTGMLKDVATLMSTPANYDLESCEPSFYRGRVKLTVNNNNTNHVTYQNIGGVNYDADYLGTLRTGNHVPSMFEKVFKPNQPRNILGFYTDSFYLSERSPYTTDTRMLPPYAPIDVSDIMVHEMSPFWYTMFDYAKYNVQQEMQFMGVWRRNPKSTGYWLDKPYSDQYAFNPDDGRVTYPYNLKYPDPNGTNEFRIKKMLGQGAYDNIHLHGYLGHYKDNDQMVMHAPICGYCCFHLHWRWGAKAYFSADSWTKFGMDSFWTKTKRSLLFEDNPLKYSFLGWSDDYLGSVTKSNQVEGMPLVPPNQHIDIAVTHPNTAPVDADTRVVSTTSTTSLDLDEKVIWYCADIEETKGPGHSHVILEQGCGYAYDYTEIGDKLTDTSLQANPPYYYRNAIDNLGIGADSTFLDAIWHVPVVGPPLSVGVCDLSTKELFEIQYRMMRSYNSGVYKNYDQMPTNAFISATILEKIEKHPLP